MGLLVIVDDIWARVNIFKAVRRRAEKSLDGIGDLMTGSGRNRRGGSTGASGPAGPSSARCRGTGVTGTIARYRTRLDQTSSGRPTGRR